MIDYLEQFFREQENGQEQRTAPAPEEVLVRQEIVTPPELMPAERQIMPVPEAQPGSSTKPASDVDIFQHTTIQNLEYTLINSQQQAGMRPVSRPDVEQAGEELERRLRRDSRRYDSGFYWY